MFAHARHVILDMRLLPLPASLTVLETASLIYAKLASLKIACLCKLWPSVECSWCKKKAEIQEELYSGMLMLKISGKFVLNLNREAIDPIKAGGHWNTAVC